MKIFIVSRGYPSEKYKMNGIFELDQAKALREAGNDVVFIAADIRSIRRWRKWGFEQTVVGGIPILAFNIPIGRLPCRIRHMFMRHSIKKLIRKAKKRFGSPDIVHAHFYHVGYVCGTIKDELQSPLVITEHSSKMATGIDEKTKRYASLAYARADGVICVSNSLAETLKNEFSVNSVCIPNIVDTSLFGMGAPNKTGFQFVSAGSLIGRKAHEVTIQAFAQAFANTDDVYLTIFGAGPERTNIERLIESLHLTNSIELAGLQSRKAMASKYAYSDCFVLCSRGETFGVAYIEALSCGLPVIATRCAGPEDFVSDENGILIDVDSITQAAEAMRHMVKYRQSYDRDRISKKIEQRFSGPVVANKLMAFYADVIEKTNHPLSSAK